mmetsp:Transcript_73422/g.203540  ORF Transcript_73422/g.203540 Transcript_73422/m.203540 type:complete len:160 (-) Transcript_73422:271-750(-)
MGKPSSLYSTTSGSLCGFSDFGSVAGMPGSAFTAKVPSPPSSSPPPVAGAVPAELGAGAMPPAGDAPALASPWAVPRGEPGDEVDGPEGPEPGGDIEGNGKPPFGNAAVDGPVAELLGKGKLDGNVPLAGSKFGGKTGMEPAFGTLTPRGWSKMQARPL